MDPVRYETITIKRNPSEKETPKCVEFLREMYMNLSFTQITKVEKNEPP